MYEYNNLNVSEFQRIVKMNKTEDDEMNEQEMARAEAEEIKSNFPSFLYFTS